MAVYSMVFILLRTVNAFHSEREDPLTKTEDFTGSMLAASTRGAGNLRTERKRGIDGAGRMRGERSKRIRSTGIEGVWGRNGSICQLGFLFLHFETT